MLIFPFGLVFSNTLMTIADILLIAIGFAFAIKFFIENKKIGLKSFFKARKSQFIFLGIYLIGVVGLIYTSNYTFGLRDLNTKLPLVIFPVVFMFLPEIKNSTIRKIIIVHCIALVAASTIILYNTIFPKSTNFRDAFTFISHIRLSLNYCASIFFLLYYFVFEKNIRMKWQILSLFVIAWFIIVLCLIKSVTGIFVLVLLFCFIVLSRNFFKTLSKRIRRAIGISVASVVIICIGFFAYSYLKYYKATTYDLNNLPEFTVNGNKYSNDISYGVVEEGDNFCILICDKELRKEWNKRSEVAYDSVINGSTIKAGLIRFLNSLDYPKDSVGVNLLTNEHVLAIEHGYANHYYTRNLSFYSRMSMFFFSYEMFKKTGNPSGSTLFQRLYFWKASFIIWKQNPVFGVGTGDIRDELNNVYTTNFPELKSEFHHCVHNQYLYYAATSGLIGLIIFVFCLIYPGVIGKKSNDYHWRFFLILVMLSMLTEDTLGTQAGVTFFTFFYFIFLFKEKSDVTERITD